MKNMLKSAGLLSVGAALLFTSGCAMFRASNEDVSVDNMKHFDADYDATDMRKITQKTVDELLASPFLTKKDKPAVMIVAGIQNRTSMYVDTQNLSDRMRTLLLQSGQAQFVNESRRNELLKEQGYQAANATAETQAAIGKQIGAQYMLTGSLTEMRNTSPKQVRISKQQLNYYKLTVELTSLETGLIVWTTEQEFARQASQPLIGW